MYRLEASNGDIITLEWFDEADRKEGYFLRIASDAQCENEVLSYNIDQTYVELNNLPEGKYYACLYAKVSLSDLGFITVRLITA